MNRKPENNSQKETENGYFGKEWGILIPGCKFTDPDNPLKLPHFELPELPPGLGKKAMLEIKNHYLFPDIPEPRPPIDGIIPDWITRIGVNLPPFGDFL